MSTPIPCNPVPARMPFNAIACFAHVCPEQITGMLTNTGHSVLFRIDTNSSQAYDDSRLAINITGGPLSYRYRFEEMHIHYGLHDSYGSEHSVQGYTFPAEVSVEIAFLAADSSCQPRMCRTGLNELTSVFSSLMPSIDHDFCFIFALDAPTQSPIGREKTTSPSTQ